MGIKIHVGGRSLEAESYSVNEDATPLTGGDTTGSVGSISFNFPQPDRDLLGAPSAWSDWVDVRKNYFRNPRLATNTTTWNGVNGTASRVNVSSSGIPDITYAYQRTGVSIASGSRLYAGMYNLTIGQTYSVSSWVSVESSVAGAVWTVRTSSSSNGTTNVTDIGLVSVLDGTFVKFSGTFVATATTMYLHLRRSGTTGTASDTETWRMTGSMATDGETVVPLFDGSFVSPYSTTQYIWDGTANNSSSTEQARSITSYDGHTNTSWHLLVILGPEMLIGEDVYLSDSRRGFTVGKVVGVQYDRGMINVECEPRTAQLNAYGIKAQPFSGTLAEAFEYYLGLAGIDADYLVDASISSRTVVLRGWTGELWYNLKLLAAAQDCDISLVSGIILLRPVRIREATRGRDIERTNFAQPGTIAQAVEVYKYNNVEITDAPVYPPGGPAIDVQVLNVNAGEIAQYKLELSSSLSSVIQPSAVDSMSLTDISASQYSVVANDGTQITAAQWLANGGSLTIEIDDTTTELNVTLRGPFNLKDGEGKPYTNFSLAMTDPDTGNRFSTLRILGSGVAFTRQKVRIRTCVPPEKASTDVGLTIDNPHISTHDEACQVGVRAARLYAGPVPRMTGDVIAINRLGDTGEATYPTYGEVQSSLQTAVSPTATYSQVQTHYLSTLSLDSYESIRLYWFDFVRDDYVNQVFGNVNGARIYDKTTRRWYRIRSGSITASGIRFEAEDDLTHGDMDGLRTSKTYGEVDLVYANMTYAQENLVGMYD